jgi:hypothetical protein
MAETRGFHKPRLGPRSRYRIVPEVTSESPWVTSSSPEVIDHSLQPLHTEHVRKCNTTFGDTYPEHDSYLFLSFLLTFCVHSGQFYDTGISNTRDKERHLGFTRGG